MVDSFEASIAKDAVISVNLKSPLNENNYTITAQIYDKKINKMVSEGILIAEVNSTFGTSEIWRAHPMNSPVTLKVIKKKEKRRR